MGDNAEETRAKAEARIQARADLDAKASQGRSEVEAERIAVTEKTARLRALRLTKEAFDRVALEPKPPKGRGKSRK